MATRQHFEGWISEDEQGESETVKELIRLARNPQSAESIERKPIEELFRMAYADVAEAAEEPEDPTPNGKRLNGFSIAGFILALFGPLAMFGFVFSVIGLCRANEKHSGKALAILGIVASILVIAIFCALCLSPYDPIAYFINLF